MPKISFAKLIIIAILFPYLSLNALWRNFKARQPIQNHSLKNVEFSKKLNIYETKEFDFNKLKFFKSLDKNVTFNHFVWAVVSKAYYDLLKTDAPHIVATFPVNYRIPSNDIQKITLANNICSVVFELPLIKSINEVGKV